MQLALGDGGGGFAALILLLVRCWFCAGLVAGFAAGFAAGFTAGLLLPTSTAIPLNPVPYSRAATLKQIPVPLAPRQIPRAALTLCLVHPQACQIFLRSARRTPSLGGDGETACQ